MSERAAKTHGAPPSSAEARATLAALDADSARLSRRVVTPSWYRLLVAAAVALPLCALIIPRVHPAAVVPLLVIWTPWMLGAFGAPHRGNDVPHRPGRRSRRAMVVTLAALAALAVVAVLLKLSTLSSWLILAPAAASFVAALLLGRRYDAIVRAEVAVPDGSRTSPDRTR